MTTENKPLSLMAAMLTVQKSLSENPIVTDQENPAFKSREKPGGSKYASLHAVMNAIRPALNNNGLLWITLPGIGEQHEPTLTYQMVHVETGEVLRGEMPLLLDRQNPQGLGSALTYAKRQSIMAVLGLTTVMDDDDGNAASRRQQPKQAAAPNGGETRQPTAVQPEATERVASAKQRGMLNAKAAEVELAPSDFANMILVASGQEMRDFDDQEAAANWLKRALDRLPAKYVDGVLKQIERVREQMPL